MSRNHFISATDFFLSVLYHSAAVVASNGKQGGINTTLLFCRRGDSAICAYLYERGIGMSQAEIIAFSTRSAMPSTDQSSEGVGEWIQSPLQTPAELDKVPARK